MGVRQNRVGGEKNDLICAAQWETRLKFEETLEEHNHTGRRIRTTQKKGRREISYLR